MSAPKFTLFPKLPIEIRLKIWNQACYLPLDIQVVVPSLTDPSKPQFKEKEEGTPAKLPYFKAITPPPALLRANSEARREALKIYKKGLPVALGKDEGIENARRIIYINPAVDTLFIEVRNYSNNFRGYLKRQLSDTVAFAPQNESEMADTPWNEAVPARCAVSYGRVQGWDGTRVVLVVEMNKTVVKGKGELPIDQLMRTGYEELELWSFQPLRVWDTLWSKLLAEVECQRISDLPDLERHREFQKILDAHQR